MKTKRIVIAGGTGFIGREITKYFAPFNEIVILTRNPRVRVDNAFSNFELEDHKQSNVRFVEWDAKHQGEWTKEIDGCDIVINLAGRSVNCRYNKANKKEIFDSRTNPTQAIGEAIRKATVPPKLWINASSATIYRHATDRPQDEYTGEYHNDFSVQVCKLWEKTFFGERTPFTRKVAFRMAITLAGGGVIMPYLNLCRFGLGGKQGSGQQMFSWVHITDICRAIEFMYERNDLEGVFNLAAPGPVTNEVFMRRLRQATGHKFGLPAYTWMLKAGAAIMGTETELLLKSRWVLPTKLQQAGFTFTYPVIEKAFSQVIGALPRRSYHLF